MHLRRIPRLSLLPALGTLTAAEVGTSHAPTGLGAWLDCGSLSQLQRIFRVGPRKSSGQR